MLQRLIFAICLVVFAQGLSAHDHSGKDHSHHKSQGHKHHSHQKLEIKPGDPIPQVSLTVTPDARRGWNIQVITQNFRFAPEKVNMANSSGEGHGHLLINGKKHTRLYSNWYYLESLPPGDHQITVTLNANGHQELASQGKVISATTMIKVPAQ